MSNPSHTSTPGTNTRETATQQPVSAQPTATPRAEYETSRLALRTEWDRNSYGATIQGSGAVKLASSSVAPLIAAARGYLTLNEPGDLTTFRRRRLHPKRGNDNVRQRINEHLNSSDVLAMPWYRLDHVFVEGSEAKMTTSQYRPAEPEQVEEFNETDGSSKIKSLKYLNESGDGTVLDIHPATPPEWCRDTRRILIIEGLLKADAALTHILLEHAASIDELSDTSGTREEQCARLTALMERIPEAHRTIVVAAAGVGNWHGNPEWNALPVRERTCFIGFDGDMTSNPAVWAQADKLQTWLEGKHAQVRFLRLDDPDFNMRVLQDTQISRRVGLNDDGQPKRLGLDDFLANVGSWQEALSTASPTIGPRPAGATAKPVPGHFYVHGDYGHHVDECVWDPVAKQTRWERRVNLGARVRAIRSGRVPTWEESQTCKANPDLSGNTSNSEVEIEFHWLDPITSVRQEAIVRGPSELLVTRPDQWIRKGAKIPPELLRHPEWPPTKYADDWMFAIKSNRADETTNKTGWSVMGFVPTNSGRPAYIVGNQVLAELRDDELDIAPGITEVELPGASRYGVIDYYSELAAESEDGTLTGDDLATYKQQVLADIRTLVDQFFERGVFGRTEIPASIVGAMLRPTCPPTPQVTLMFWGPPAGGKSYAAAAAMGGWRASARSWHENSLPGQAGDTAASHELAVSMTPIWVADDLAPSTDRGKAERQEAQIGDLIRNIFNGSPKRRTDQGRTMRESNDPRALLVATAENEPTVDSVRDRAIMVEIGAGTFADNAGRTVDELRTFFTEHPALPRLTAAMIRYWYLADGMMDLPWHDRVEIGQQLLRDAQHAARRHIFNVSKVRSNRQTRHSKLAGELAMPFLVLRELALWAGCPHDDPLLDKFSIDGDDSLIASLFTLVARALTRQAQSTPGAALMTALSSLLASGRAHIANPDDAGAPPLPSDDPDNERLGWQFDMSRGEAGQWIPRGNRIGYLTERSRNDSTLLAHLSTEDAFNEAKRHYANLLPHGSGPQSAWADVWNQGYAAGVRPTTGVSIQISARPAGTANPSSRRIRGVPVLWEALRDPEQFRKRQEEHE